MQKLGNWRVQMCGCTRQGLKVIPWCPQQVLLGMGSGPSEAVYTLCFHHHSVLATTFIFRLPIP